MMTQTSATAKVTRRYDLDWLRVIAILFVFLYHSTRFFNLEDWNVKNATTYSIIQVWTDFLDVWGMPLIFVISGASVFYALGQGQVGKFVKNKVLRLLVPWVVGVFTLSIMQVYLERLTHGQFTGSFFEFLPHYFQGFYGFGGNFAWMGFHLWYLEILLIFNLVCLPLFLWLKSSRGARLLGKLGDGLAAPGAIYLLALPVLLLNNLQNPDSLLGKDIFGWSLGIYLSFFLSGFVIIASERLQHSIQRLRWVSLTGAIALTLVYLLTQDHEDVIVWFWILAFLGFGMKRLNFYSPTVEYANEAVLPFYVLHQPVLIGVGYFVVQWPIPDLLKWLIITPTSFVIIMTVYEFLIRRANVLRFLFGLKPLPKTQTQPAPQPAQ